MSNFQNIIISGATGFVGTNLGSYFTSKGIDFISLSRKRRHHDDLLYETLKLSDLDSKEAFIHLAGKAHDTKNTGDDREYFVVNTQLTISLFEKFLSSSCRTFIFMSSVKAVADEVEGILTEDVIANPATAYGKSKLKAEEYILSKKIPDSKRVYILRPCMIHGPGNKGNLNILYSFVRRGISYPLGAFNNLRSFVSIHTLCFLIEELLLIRPPGGVFNISDDEPLSTNEVVRVMYDVENKKPKITNIPRNIVKSIAWIGNYLKLPLNSERLKKLTENYVVSNAKIKNVLNIREMFNTREGLRITIKSFSKK